MKVEIVVLESTKEIARITSRIEFNETELSVEEDQQLIDTEALLEKLTGYRFHINLIG